MEYTANGPVLKGLLVIGDKVSRTGTRKELLPLPNGQLAFERSLSILRDALPAAETINISVHDRSQMKAITARLDHPDSVKNKFVPDPDHSPSAFPEIHAIFHKHSDIGPTAGLLAAHSEFPTSSWLVIGCDYPNLPPSALQQLILEFEPPVTCFISDSGFVDPLIGVWSSEALERLEEYVRDGRRGLDAVVEDLGGKLVRPLRDEWIVGDDTQET